VDIESGGLLTHKAGQTGFNLTVLNDANIASGGSISVDGKGYGPASGPGAGESKFQAGGAGYGGEGGNNSGAWGQTYGSIVEPIDLGSGGGSDEHGATGGAGGGLIRLNVNRTLQIDGVLTVKGNKGKYYSFYNRSGGGGAGGSVYIVAGSIKGSGLIAADGGDSGLSGLGGGGGGGRITIYYEDTSDFNLGNISASGGSGYQTGQSGTVLLIGPDETPIISVDTLSAGYVLDPFDHVDIVFTRPIDPNTFTSEDVYILGPNGEVHVTGIVLTNEIASRETYSVYFPIQTANGTYRVTIGTDIMGANGQPISEGYEATFILDSIGPRITKHSPAGDLAGTIEFVDIWFSEILHVPSLSLDDIMIEGPSGSITPTALADIGLSGYRISFPEQTTYGQYHVLIGPEIEDIAGNTMDQDRDGTRGEPNDDAYDASFNLVDVDLTLSNVLVDANKLWAGELVDVSWEGYNYSGMPLLGSWVDAVYLSEDDQWDIDDRLLTKVSHTGGLAQDESYLQDVTVLIPGALPGDYYIIVRADVHDDEKEGAGEGDNIVPVGPNPLSVEVLSTDGVPIVGWLSDGNHMDYYKIDVNNGQNLSLVLEQFDANSVIDFFVSYEIIPTRLKYDYRSIVNIIGNQETILPATLGGSYYVLVYGDQITGESSYNLTADTPDLIVTCISPEHHGQASLCTMTLTGGDFNEATTVEFKGTDESIWLPTSIQLISRTTLVAEINTPIWPIDIYDITVSRPGVGSFELPDAFEVITGIPHLDARVIVPDQVGYHWFVIIWIEYANTGGASMPSPLFKLHGSDDAIMTLDNSVARVGLWTDTPPAGTSDTIQVMATGSGATPGILQPGDSGRIPVYYLGLKQPWNMSDRSISFDLGVLTIENTETINWSLLEDQMRPADVDVDAWHAVFLNLAERIGSTWGDYVAKLNENMNYLFSVGQTVNESQRLWNFELMQASDLLNPYCFDSVTDAVSPAPSLPLMFTRSRSKGILGQYNLGALGRGWAHNWDIHGEGTRTDPDGMVWQFRQDGLLDYVEDRNGNRITVGYTSGQLTSITHSNGDQLLLDYNPDGRIWHLVDPRSLDPNDDRVTVFEYDASGEYLMEVSAPGSRVTNYTYETAGTPQQKHAILSVEYPDNSHKYFVYDSNGRLEETYRDGGAEPITYTYDIPGQVIVEGCGGCSNIKTTYCYAADGQIAQIRDGIGSVTRFSYDYTGNLIKVTGPDGQQYRYSYDDNGNVVSFEDPLRKITTFTYESNFNKPRSITDARGNNIKYNYDTAGNLLSIIYEDSNSESYNYYPDGSIHTWTNRRGQTITYDYYDNGLVAHKDYSTTPEPNDYIYGYDTAGNLILAADPCGSITMTYDPNTSWLTRIDYPQGRCFIFEYDAMGRRTKRTDQDNHMIKYIYDAVGRLNLVTDSNDVNIVDYDYDSDGRLDVKTLGNEVYTVYNYNAAGHVTNVVNHRPDDSILSSFFYTYDASGRRTSMTTLAGTYVYGYDPLGQLTSVTYPSDYVVEYVYDAVGNRIRIIDKGTPILYTTNNMNQYEDVNGAFYTYDYDGCLETRIEGGITTYYTHDIERRLVQVSEPNDTWVYAYDGLGNRVKSTYNEVSTEYIVDPIGYGNVAAEYNADGNLTVEYLYGHGLLARVNQTGDNAYYTFDALGSTVEITDVAGNPLNNYVYDPFGIILTQSETIPNPFKYIGEDGVMEEGNGLKFMRARYYEPLTGRFIQPDPLGIKGGLNLYTYAENDPINKKDPLGLVSDDYSRCVDNCELVCKYGRWLLMVIIGVLLLVFALQAAALYTKVLILMFSGAFGSFLGTFCHEFCKFKCYIEVEVPLLAQEVPAERLDYRGYGISHMVDPSDKLGPAGFSNAKYVGKDNLMAYKIRFENELNATAPAHFIKITDTFDDDLDLSTFELEEIAFAGYTIIVPEGLSHYETTMEIEVDNEYVSSAQLLMEIDASLNYSTRELTFSMIGLDPNTGWLPENIAIGVLYPNDANGRGDGHISFTVKPKPNLPSGSKIMNKASIKFDWNDELITPLVLNTIDANAPTSTVSELPAESNDLSVNVSWAGADDANGSGIGSYNIYVSDNNGVYVLWLEGTTDTSATFIGEHGHTYRFYSVATDNVGYVEQEPNAPDATVAIYDRTVPQIVSVVINNGQAQRSRIDKFAVKFNEDLSVTKDILTLYNNTTGMDVNLSSLTTGDFDYNDVNFTATWDLSGTVFEDGNHIATISAALVVDTGGNYLDGNGDGTGGDDFTYDFVRLLGDFDGNGQVDCVDLAQFVEKWLWIGPAGDVLEDLQVDGTVNLLDFAALAERWAGSQ
jgi:RHS repeat-associated protein